jgi:hypothetical protein
MTMLPARTGVSDTYPNPTNGVARAAFGAIWDVLSEAYEAAEVSVVAAATIDIGGQASMKLLVTGTASITSLGTNYRGPVVVRFSDTPTLTHNAATLLLPNSANISVVAGDVAIFAPKSASGTVNGWQCVSYVPSTAAGARANLGLGTAAVLNVGTSANSVVKLDSSGKLPAVDGSALTGIGSGSNIRVRSLTSGTVYTTPSDVKRLYVFVSGATGSASRATVGYAVGGAGGPGYSEKYYATPAASYTYSIGAGGTMSGNTNTAGGTTTFDVMTVTGSGGGVVNGAGGAGGIGSGGGFNATGGSGGACAPTGSGGGGGGAGSRAGNGYAGGNVVVGYPNGGGGGGTGGAGQNTSQGVNDGWFIRVAGGIAATSQSGSAIALSTGVESPGSPGFLGGSGTTIAVCGGSPTDGGNGASAQVVFPTVSLPLTPYAPGGQCSGFPGASNGRPGQIIIFEMI